MWKLCKINKKINQKVIEPIKKYGREVFKTLIGRKKNVFNLKNLEII